MNRLTKTHLRRLKIRRGSNLQRTEVVFEEGEPAFIKDKKSVFIGDNVKYGGNLASTKNHQHPNKTTPPLSNTFDIVIDMSDMGGYMVEPDDTLRQIFLSKDDISRIETKIHYVDDLLDRLIKGCCNPDFHLITDLGDDIITDQDEDWISVRNNPVCPKPIVVVPKVVKPLSWTALNDVTDNIWEVDLKSTFWLTISAVGDGAISYQWYRDTPDGYQELPSFNSDTLTITDINFTHLTSYKCVASSTVTPSITSGANTLVLKKGSVTGPTTPTTPTTPPVGPPTPPTGPTGPTTPVPLSFSTQPKDVSTNINGVATFTVNAVGDGTISYQWYKSLSPFNPIVGETNKTLNIVGIKNTDFATYQCVAKSSTMGEISSNQVKLTLIATPPTPPAVEKPLSDSTDATSYPDHILYTAKFFKIYVLIKKSANFSNEALEVIKDAINKWSAILKDTKLPDMDQSSTIHDQRGATGEQSNPLKFKNDGYVLVVDSDKLKNADGSNNMSTLAFANASYVRVAPNQKHHLLPSVGFSVINTNTLDLNLKQKVGLQGKSTLYKVVFHELGHALGIGVLWFWLTNSTTLKRSYIVGAGDNCANSNNSVFANIFYTADRGTNGRTASDVMDSTSFSNLLLSTFGDAKFKFAFNPDNPRSNISSAVTAYNEAFGLSLSAIPLENAAVQGSYGGHWAEGGELSRLFASNVEDYGADNRQYYGVTYPGAPGMQDEMMTPRTPILDSEMPISKITLGGLEDLGWTVDYKEADNYEPLVHAIRYSSDGSMFEIKKNNFGAYFPAHESAYDPKSTKFRLFLHLRKGLTYKFINETGEDLSITNTSNVAITQGVSNITIGGVKYLQYVIPTNLSVDEIIIKGTKTSTKPKAKVFWMVV